MDDAANEAPGSPTPIALAARRATDELVTAAYRAHQRELYSFALHGTRDPEAAEDLTQEAFVRLLREVADGHTPDNVRAWLYRVVANLIVSRGRRSTVADRWRSFLGQRDETHESPELLTLRRESNQGVRDALGDLSADARTALLLAASGFSGREIATTIGRTEAATRVLLCRARLQLRQRVEAAESG